MLYFLLLCEFAHYLKSELLYFNHWLLFMHSKFNRICWVTVYLTNGIKFLKICYVDIGNQYKLTRTVFFMYFMNEPTSHWTGSCGVICYRTQRTYRTYQILSSGFTKSYPRNFPKHIVQYSFLYVKCLECDDFTSHMHIYT